MLSSVVASQEELHQKFHGVVPEIAARAHLERILPVIDETLKKGKSFTQSTGCNSCGYNSRSGWISAGWLNGRQESGILFESATHFHQSSACSYLCLQNVQVGKKSSPVQALLSPAVTLIFIVVTAPSTLNAWGEPLTMQLVKHSTKWPACLNSLIQVGLPFLKLQSMGIQKHLTFPVHFLKTDELQFSFSGLKTAVRYEIAPPGSDPHQAELSEQKVADLAASFQAAVVDCLVAKCQLVIS